LTPEGPAPVSILRQGSHLVASIHTALDDTQMVRFRCKLGEAISGGHVRGVLIDVTALDVLDSFGSRAVSDIAEMARLHGATAVIVGVQPQLALAMVRLGIDAGAIPTALDLEDGLEVVDGAGRRARRARTGGGDDERPG